MQGPVSDVTKTALTGFNRAKRAITAGVAASVIATAMTLAAWAPSAQAMSLRLLAVVEGEPITDADVIERMRLDAAVSGELDETDTEKKKLALRQLVDDIIKRKEAEKFGIEIPETNVANEVSSIAKRAQLSMPELEAKLSKTGASLGALKEQVRTNIAFRSILRRLYNVKVDVSDVEVDRRFEKFLSDPRLKPILLYRIQDVRLPIGDKNSPNARQLLLARAVESQSIIQKYKGCGSLKRVSRGIFDVRIGPVQEAPADRLPEDLKKALDQAGTRKLIGPIQGPDAIQLLAFCGTKEVLPPRPTKQVVKNIILNEKFNKATERVMRSLRRKAAIDFKVNEDALAETKLIAVPVPKDELDILAGPLKPTPATASTTRAATPQSERSLANPAAPQTRQTYVAPGAQPNIYARPQQQYAPQQPQYGQRPPQYAVPQVYVYPQYDPRTGTYIYRQYTQPPQGRVPVYQTPQYRQPVPQQGRAPGYQAPPQYGQQLQYQQPQFAAPQYRQQVQPAPTAPAPVTPTPVYKPPAQLQQ